MSDSRSIFYSLSDEPVASHEPAENSVQLSVIDPADVSVESETGEEHLTPAEAQAQLRALYIEQAVDATEIGVGTEVWVGIYWLMDSYKTLGKWPGYALHGLSEGLASNAAAALLSVLKSRWDEGEISSVALLEAFKYLVIYLPLDSCYQVMEDLVIAADTGEFEQYADPTGNTKEVLVALAGFGVGFSLLHYLMTATVNRLTTKGEKNPADPLKSGLVGSQYFVFYLTDLIFNVDLEGHPKLGVRNSFLSSLVVAAYALVSNIVINPEMWELRRLKSSPESLPRHRRGCWSIFKSYLPGAQTAAPDVQLDEQYQSLRSP